MLHFALEPTVAPSLGALGAGAAVGVVPLALGNFVWDEGFRRGDSQLLAVWPMPLRCVAPCCWVPLGWRRLPGVCWLGP